MRPFAGRSVLVAVDYFHPSVGGSERVAEDAGVALQRLGWKVDVATRLLPERVSLSHRGMTIHQIVSGVDSLREFVSDGDYDAVLAISDPFSWPVAAAVSLPEPRPRVVAVPCINAQNYGTLSARPDARERYRARASRADALVYSSIAGYDARLCDDLGLAGVYVPNAVSEVAPEGRFREPLGIEPDVSLLLAVGNRYPEKNHLGLLTTLCADDGDWRLAIVGQPSPDHPDVSAAVEALAARDPRVILVPGATPGMVAAAMAESDVLLLPSLAEATPLVLLEAMRARLPWVATPTCGSAHDHAGGLILPLGRFPAAVSFLVADPGARAALGEAGREHYEAAYNWDVVGARYAAVLAGSGGLAELTPPAAALRATEAVRARCHEAAPARGPAPMSPDPLVTCIVPSHNYASYIGRALDSAIAQDYPAELLEIVVIDDGSTDETAEVVAGYGERVRYVRKENGGLNSAVDRGIAEASGELIAILDADDTWPPAKVREQVELLKARPEVGLVYGDMEVIDADDRLVSPSFFGMYGVTPARGRILPTLVRRNVVSGGSAMFRASLRDSYHPIGAASAFPDWWIAVGIARVAEVEWLPEPANRYRLHGDNMGFGVEDAAKLARVQRDRDIPFRRWLLADLHRAEVRPADLIDGWAVLAGSVTKTAEALGEPLEAIAPVPADARERAAQAAETGIAALHAGDLTAAVSALVAALALNPFDARAGSALDAVAPFARAAAPPTPFADARSRVTIALAEEVAAEPSLLADYAAAQGSDSDATLVIYAPGAAEDEAYAVVAGAIDAAGIDADGGPDLMLHVSAGGLGEAEAVAAHAHALLGRGVSAFEHLPRLDAAGGREAAGV